ncbi:hypothetical protein T03_6505 [Trichinella britovi]|uniref:Uncharacterized protein n=1 Tax=Trichinella britovi TaxID=45882 RepID=A0A0V1DHR2_TRIBR|nr:hypothetical protein T03_6505 [Trichinella britovi]KRZ98100.1 hypothetical protein T08_5930 [Trichinella sp. T8]
MFFKIFTKPTLQLTNTEVAIHQSTNRTSVSISTVKLVLANKIVYRHRSFDKENRIIVVDL